MEKGFRALLVCWITLLSVVTAGSFSYNDYLDSLPGCALRGQCSQEVPQHCRHGNASLDGQLLMFRHNWMVIFRSLEFPCDGAILNVSMAMNVTVHEEQGIELQTWRFYPNSSLMLVQWAVPRRTECIGCSKNPMYLSEPLSFKKGDALGIYLRTDQTHLHYVHVGSRELPVASTEALLLSVSDVEEIHQAQGKVVTRNFLANRSDGFGQRIFPLSTAYPQIELELSLALNISSSGVATSTVSNLLTLTPTPTPTSTPTPTPTPTTTQLPPTPTDQSAGTNKSPDQLSKLAVAIILSFVSLTFVAVTVVLLSLVVVLCLRRYRLRKKIEVRIEEERESVVDKVPPPADVVSEYDQVGHSFMASSRSMMSSVASLAHGRYDVNQTDASGPLDAVSGQTPACSVLSNGSGALPSLGFDHDYSAVGPPLNESCEYDLPEESQGYEDVYVHPPSTEKELYSQLTRQHYEAIDRKYIEFVRCIGVGEFGRVCMGYWNTKGYRRKVAIKTLNLQAEEQDRIRFLQEAAIMAQFRHPNIVNLFGVVKEGEPKMIVLELMDMGDLRSVLMDAKAALGETTSKDLHILLLKFSRQISDGMDYLAKKCFIHRDLAARNILVTDNYVCKIGDFGLARDLAYDSYYLSSGGLVPVRWTAPEALIYGRFSSASDVWSFGALLYEIWSLGHKPFEDTDNQEVVELVQTGHRLAPPPGCPRMVYSVMISCWHPQAHLRPDFSDVRAALRQSQSSVLEWASEDMTKDPLSLHLGAPLVHGKALFMDLQSTYVQTEKLEIEHKDSAL